MSMLHFLVNYSNLTLIILKLFFVLAFSPAEGEIVFRVSPENASVTSGDNVRFRCSTLSLESVDWQFKAEGKRAVNVFIGRMGGGGGEMSSRYKFSRRVSVDMNTTYGQYDLVIKNVTSTDEGVYICSDISKPEYPADATLDVKETVDSVLQVSPRVVNANNGDDVRLPCWTENMTSVDWMFKEVGNKYSHVFMRQIVKGGEMSNGYKGKQRHSIGMNAITGQCDLLIRNVSKADEGEYMCLDGSRSHYSAKIVLVIFRSVGTVFRVSPNNALVMAGEDVRFRCSTKSLESVDWQFEAEGKRAVNVFIGRTGRGGEMSSQYKSQERIFVDVNITTGQYDLVIKNVTKSDEGVYSCSDISLPEYPASARLVILKTVETVFQVAPENASVKADDDVRFRCSTRSLKSVDWQFKAEGKTTVSVFIGRTGGGGEMSNQYNDQRRIFVDVNTKSGQYDLVITNVMQYDQGVYICSDISEPEYPVRATLVILHAENDVSFDFKTTIVASAVVGLVVVVSVSIGIAIFQASRKKRNCKEDIGLQDKK